MQGAASLRPEEGEEQERRGGVDFSHGGREEREEEEEEGESVSVRVVLRSLPGHGYGGESRRKDGPAEVSMHAGRGMSIGLLAERVTAALLRRERESDDLQSEGTQPQTPPVRLFHLGQELQDLNQTLGSLGRERTFVLSATAGVLRGQLTLNEVMPTSCSEAGGVEVLLHGQGFSVSPVRPLLARFGVLVVPATPLSHDVAKCIAPGHAPGVVAVEVSREGHVFTSSGVLFTYWARRDAGEVTALLPATRHCFSLNIAQELERAALRNHREF